MDSKYRTARNIARAILSSLILTFFCSCSSSDDKIGGSEDPSGKVFKRDTIEANYVEYRTGNCRLVISVPHGGYLDDNNLIKRTSSNCPDTDFATVMDDKTIELANAIDSIFFAKTGKYPYVVIGKISRRYVDFNRKASYAVPRNAPNNSYIYTLYHDWIKKAEEFVGKEFGGGLLVDIHGQSHAVKQVEIGYLLRSYELDLDDSQLAGDGSYLYRSSIYRLVHTNKSGSSFVDLIRGPYSMGSLMYKNGLNCVPHSANPTPGDLPYFNGGYITMMYGSSEAIGMVDAIQFEFDNVSRQDRNRKNTATAFVEAVTEFLNLHYGSL